MTQVVKPLPSKCKTLSSNPSPPKNTEKEKEKQQVILTHSPTEVLCFFKKLN
jgi:hypothetical protein